MLMNDRPGVASASQDDRAAAGAGCGGAVKNAGPVEAEDASGQLRGLGEPDDVADAIGFVFDRVEVPAEDALDLGFTRVFGAVAEPIDGVVVDQAEGVIETFSAGGFVFADELLGCHEGSWRLADARRARAMMRTDPRYIATARKMGLLCHSLAIRSSVNFPMTLL